MRPSSAQEAPKHREDIGQREDHGGPAQAVQKAGKGVDLLHVHGASDTRAQRQQQVAAEAPDGACLSAQQSSIPQPL